MHDLLNEEELNKTTVLIILNYKKKEGEEEDKKEVNKEAEEEGIENDNNEENHKDDVENEMKKTIYFHLIPQIQKYVFYLDMYDKKPSTNDIKKVRIKMTDYIGKFV